MKNLKQAIKENNGIICIVIVITLTLLLLITTNKLESQVYINKELDKKLEYTQENLQIANKKTKIEIIKDQIERTKSSQNDFNKEFEQAKKNKEANVWFLRCLETEGELELKGGEYDLICYKYEIVFMAGIGGYNEDTYKELQDFATYNLQETRNKLGL